MSAPHRPLSRHLVGSLLVALLLAACAAPDPQLQARPEVLPPVQAPLPPCSAPATVALSAFELELDRVSDAEERDGSSVRRTRLHAVDVADISERSLELIATGRDCARTVVASAMEPFNLLAVAAQLAAGEGLPLLILPAIPPGSAQAAVDTRKDLRIRATLQRLGVLEVLTFGPSAAALRPHLPVGVTVTDLLDGVPPEARTSEVTPAAAEVLAARWQVEVVEVDASAVEELAREVASGRRDRVMLPIESSAEGEPGAATAAGAAASPAASAPRERTGPLWLGDLRDPAGLLLTASVAGARGEAFATVNGEDPRRGVDRTALVREGRGDDRESAAILVGAANDDSAWQFATLLDGTPLPGERFLPLEGRRIVALYGAPGYPGLGALGQQDLEATLERARAVASGYAEETMEAVAGLDLIVTIASAEAGPRGDYSRRLPIAEIRPLVDRAGEEGFIVFLDLQPGRTSFLEQAKEYEELLLLPHVGLALDPEWRLGPDEVHLRRIGSVEAEEVQLVIDWLAALVRRELLPQKVLVLHQFTLDMLRDRDTLEVPSELVGVVHVDGQGSLAAKYRTYATMTAGAEDRWLWGWKNFLRIDRPLATPEQVLALDPAARVITYQ